MNKKRSELFVTDFRHDPYIRKHLLLRCKYVMERKSTSIVEKDENEQFCCTSHTNYFFISFCTSLFVSVASLHFYIGAYLPIHAIYPLVFYTFHFNFFFCRGNIHYYVKIFFLKILKF